MIIKTDPHNEILEVWDELSGSFVVLALFAGGTVPDDASVLSTAIDCRCGGASPVRSARHTAPAAPDTVSETLA